jgi:hypothetical protein
MTIFNYFLVLIVSVLRLYVFFLGDYACSIYVFWRTVRAPTLMFSGIVDIDVVNK